MTCMHARVLVIVFGARNGTYIHDMPMGVFATTWLCMYTAHDITSHAKVLVIVHLCLGEEGCSLYLRMYIHMYVRTGMITHTGTGLEKCARVGHTADINTSGMGFKSI